MNEVSFISAKTSNFGHFGPLNFHLRDKNKEKSDVE